MDNDPSAIAKRVADKLIGTRKYRVTVEAPVWESTTYEVDVPNDVTTDGDINAYVREKIDENPDEYEVSSSINSEVFGVDTQYEIEPI